MRSNNSGDDKDNSGFIKTEPFEIVYLRRKMTVEKMILDLSKSEDGIIPVDARIKVEQTQYTIFIDIKGPATKPNVILSSDPYLPAADIISVLLYDKVTDQSGESETAGSVQAAMADRFAAFQSAEERCARGDSSRYSPNRRRLLDY